MSDPFPPEHMVMLNMSKLYVWFYRSVDYVNSLISEAQYQPQC